MEINQCFAKTLALIMNPCKESSYNLRSMIYEYDRKVPIIYDLRSTNTNKKLPIIYGLRSRNMNKKIPIIYKQRMQLTISTALH